MCCPYNKAVECDKDNHNCDKCGWNPKVDEERRPKTRDKVTK